MSATVKTLLSLQIYKDNVSIICEGDLDREVESLTVMEAPDFHFSAISKNALILTTLSTHHDSLEDINDTIESLCKAGVSGIIIKLGRFINEIDESTRLISKQYNISLLSLNQNVYFTDIISSSYFYIVNDYALVTREINDLNNELMIAVSQNRTSKELMKIIDKKFKSNSFLLDNQLKIVESTSNNQEVIDTVVSVTKKLIEHRKTNKKHLFQQRDNVIVHVCDDNYKEEGYYGLVVRNLADLPDSVFMQSISRIMSIKLLENEIIENAKRQMVSTMADDILFTEHNDEQVIIDRLKMLHFSPKDKHMIMIINKGKNNVKNSQLFNVVEKVVKKYCESSFVFSLDDSLIALVSESESRFSKDFREKINECAREISKTIGKKINFATSSFTDDLRNIPNCYNQAKKASRFGRHSNDSSDVYFYDDFIDIGLVSHGLDSKTSDIFFKKIINPIIEYDKQYNYKLWETLECCFRSQSLEEASQNMYIHISTLRYRISKIESLTGYDYMNNKQRMTLYLAYLLYRAKL